MELIRKRFWSLSRNGRRVTLWKWWAGLLVAGLGLVLWRPWQEKANAGAGLRGVEPVSVAVAQVTRGELCKALTVPAEFRPYAEVELHAKVSGYVDQMKVDFGDRVKSGQLLATLVVPELLEQLHNATADRKRAEADYVNAHLIYTRLLAVNKDHPNLVAQQDLDTAQAKDLSADAARAAAKAEEQRYQALVGYTQISAPFDGVITHRYADPGALIQAGTSSETQSMPLVRVSNNYLLRLDFPVSVDYVKDIRVGDSVEVHVESLGKRRFTGKITRFADQVDEATRTMPVEIEVPNANLELVPGMYATVDLKVERREDALAVPVEAVKAGETSCVWLISAGHEVVEQPVTLGLETADKYEVLAGLKQGDLVMIGNPGQIRPGDRVEPKLVHLLAER